MGASCQARGVIDLAVRKVSTSAYSFSLVRLIQNSYLQLVTVHAEFEPFRKYGFWAPRAFFQMVLRVKANEARKQEAKLLQPDEEKPVAKPRKRRGKPRKNQLPVPKDQPTPGVEPVVAAQSVLGGGPVAAPKPVPKPLQGRSDDDDGEEFDLDPPSDAFDSTMASAIQDLSIMSVDPSQTGNKCADNDEGKIS
jgi:hypothetical protein